MTTKETKRNTKAITLYTSPELHKTLKKLAADDETSIVALVETALRDFLKKKGIIPK